MSLNEQKCYVIVLGRKPRVKKGRYFPNFQFGVYGIRKRDAFGIPEALLPNTSNTNIPSFYVNPNNQLAQPIGTTQLNIIENWIATKGKDKKPQATLQIALEVATQAKWVKAMVLKVRDMVEILIYMGAGAGVLYAGLTVLSVVTKTPIVFGAGS